MHGNDYVISSECLPTTTLSLTTTTNSVITTMTDNFNSNNQHIVHAGYLIKSPPENRIWKTKWRRRWFVLKLSGQIPGQYVLEYYTDATCKKLKGQIDLDQCEQVDAGLQLEIQQKNYDNMFDLRTTKRTYYLVASCEDEMNRWVECICSVCGLKIEAIQNELALLPQLEMHNNNNNNNVEQEQRYSPQPSQNEQLQQQQSSPSSSQQQSTSESSLSTLNYIPISECYSGKPTKKNSKNHPPPLPLSSSPPPRPPKPPTLQFSKSQSSLALWPQDSQPQQQHLQNSPTTKNQQSIFSSQSSTMNQNNLPPKSSIPSNLVIYNNGTNNKPSYIDSSKSKNTPYNVYDTWHSRSRPDFLSPPQVNRDLKPQRRVILEQQSQNINKINNQKNIKSDGQIVMNPLSKQQFKRINNQSQPILSNTNRHTLPRPLIQRYSLRNNQNKTNNNDNNDSNDNYCHLAYCEQPKTIEDCERQYLDLDLDSDTNNNNTSNSNSPKALNNDNNYNASTVAASSSSNVNPNSNMLTTSTTIVPNDLVNSSQIHSNRNNNLNHIPNLLNNNENSSLNTNTIGLVESDNCGTVYKKVDFLKTKAFNIMRVNVVSNRNPNQ